MPYTLRYCSLTKAVRRETSLTMHESKQCLMILESIQHDGQIDRNHSHAGFTPPFPSKSMSDWEYTFAVPPTLPTWLHDGCNIFIYNIFIQLIAEARNSKQSEKKFSLLFDFYSFLPSLSPTFYSLPLPPPPLPYPPFNSRTRFPRCPPADFILCLLARTGHLYTPRQWSSPIISRNTYLNLISARFTIIFTREISRIVPIKFLWP